MTLELTSRLSKLAWAGKLAAGSGPTFWTGRSGVEGWGEAASDAARMGVGVMGQDASALEPISPPSSSSRRIRYGRNCRSSGTTGGRTRP
jgi:hypothetical protein